LHVAPQTPASQLGSAFSGDPHRVPHDPHAVVSVARFAHRALPSGLAQQELPAAHGLAAVPHTHCVPEAQRSASGPQTAQAGPQPDALVEAALATHADHVPPG
jgi:hypothetical protein